MQDFLFILLAFFCLSQAKAQGPWHFSTKNGLPTNHVYDMLQDDDGFMWLATNRGLVKFDGHDFKYFTHVDGLPNNDTWKLDLDKKGRLWFFSKSDRQGFLRNDSIHVFQTANKQTISPVYFYDYGSFIAIDYQKNVFEDSSFIENKHRIKSEKFSHLIEIISKKKYLAFRDNSAHIIDYRQQVLQSFELPIAVEPTKVSSFLSGGKYLVAHSSRWMLCYNLETEEFSYLDLRAYGFDNTMVRVRVKNDAFQISTKGKLLILNRALEVVENHQFDEKYDGLFSYKDRNGNIWVYGVKNGVYLFTSPQNHGIYHLRNKKITTLGKIQGQLIATDDDGSTYFYNDERKLFEKKSELSTKRGGAYDTKSYGDMDYLIKQFGIYEISPTTTKKVFHKNLGHWSSGGKDFVKFKGEDYVVHSVYVTNLTTDKVIEKTGLFKGIVYKNHLIFGGSKGLAELKGESIVPYETDDAFLNDISIIDLLIEGEYLLIGTDGRGLFIVHDKKARQVEFTENTSIYKVVVDDGFIWLGTNAGLKKLSYSEGFEQIKLVDEFYENDGLLQNKINDFAFHHNELWIANDLGVASINPENQIFNHPIQLYFKNISDSLLIQPTQARNQTIRFGAVDFFNQNRLNFSYRLLPTDTVWRQVTSREINFNNLRPNSYSLEIKAQDQHFNVGKKTLPITVRPKWSERPMTVALFILLGVGLLSMLLVGLLRYQHQKKMQKIEQNRNLKRIELQALRAQMNPHFVHNSLNSILYYIQVADVKKSEEYLTRFSVLIRMFFEYSRQKLVSLNKEIELIKNYLEIEKLRFEDKIEYEIVADENLNINERKIPSLLLQPIVENAVNHGLFHKKSNGHICITFEYIDPSSYRVLIDDDGVGYEKTKEIYAKSLRKYSSRSGQVLTERLKLLREAGEWNIDYKIIDKVHEGKQGTRVEIMFARFYD